jgi:hypothetical protein
MELADLEDNEGNCGDATDGVPSEPIDPGLESKEIWDSSSQIYQDDGRPTSQSILFSSYSFEDAPAGFYKFDRRGSDVT